ncbi:MAG: porphobilinogen synthase [Candidatus Omnitrophota bacterium]
MMELPKRPRRNRRSESIRTMLRETLLAPHHLVLPLFVQEGKNLATPIASMPGCSRLSPDLLLKEVRQAADLGIQAIALFPCISEWLKDKLASESKNPKGLIPSTVRLLKQSFPKLTVITDVAMDPYSSDGHDGIYEKGEVLNDETLPALAEMAIVQAQAGADYVAPSDMMDGRIGFIRRALDKKGFMQTGILSYAVKYCSALYGPFRGALDSAPRAGDKKTYQMDPANIREALRETVLDVEEGADIVMIKPALPCLDVIAKIRERVDIPVAAYQVSGEFAMIRAAAHNGAFDEKAVILESLTAIKRAGADLIFTYFAKAAAQLLGD